MKKIIFFTAALFLVHQYSLAQRKIEYGFQLGGGLANQHTDNSDLLSHHSIRTFNINAVINFPVLRHYYVSLKPGLTNKGTIITEDALTTTSHITYYELPVYLVRKFEIPTLGKITGGLGGYMATGAKGNLTFETPGSQNSDRIAFGDANDFQKYDTGISVMAGLELNNRLTFNLGYDFGLYNIASQPLKDTGTTKINNRAFTVNIGLLF